MGRKSSDATRKRDLGGNITRIKVKVRNTAKGRVIGKRRPDVIGRLPAQAREPPPKRVRREFSAEPFPEFAHEHPAGHTPAHPEEHAPIVKPPKKTYVRSLSCVYHDGRLILFHQS